MKPRRLKMSAFGSYARDTEIDFTGVQQGVFLITGDTGSGKTTIFDGITYALYGQTSGGRRDGSMMRSQYAAAGTKTYVELEFENRGEIYRVVRNPEYERESKRKNKEGNYTLTTEKAGVELYLPDGSLYRGNRQEVNRKLVEILGVDVKQFTQIAMIAQGDFLKLLLAKSDERKEIFSRIFDTRIFWRVQEELKTRTKQLYVQLEDNRKSCLRETEALEGTDEEENLQKRGFLDRGQKEPELKGILELAEELNRKDQQMYQEKLKESREQSQELDKQNSSFSLAKAAASQFEELDRIQSFCKALSREEHLWKQREEQIRKAEKCTRILPLEEAREREKKNLADTEQRLGKLEQWFELHGKETEEKKKRLDAVQEYHKLLEEKEIPVLNRLSQSLEQYQGLQEHLRTAEQMERRLGIQKEVYKEAEEKYHKLRGYYEEMYQAYFREQAGILAAQLQQGEPCPVCGSVTHPHKAVLSSGAPAREQVERVKKEREEGEKQREREQEKLLQIQRALEGETAVIRELQQRLLGEESRNDSLEQIREKWESWEKKARQRLDTGNKKILETKKKLAEYEEAYQRAVREENIRKGQREENLALEKHQREALRDAEERFRQGLAEAGFSEEKIYQECRMTSQELEKNRKEVDIYRKKQIESEQKQIVLEEQLKDRERPDLERLSEMLRDGKRKQESLEKELRKIYSRREKNRAAASKLSALSKEREELRKQYEKVSNLSRTANGSLSGSVKIDFESYMQRQYFERMIRCANHHLQKMASGQFLLKCRSLENLSTQGNSGLDLDVYSMVTGKIRDVKTLSGGESFMAALALALGMTDVITRTMGAVRVDTLFIDEGFGSLDENAREQAVRILQGLAGEQRLVGIISHVTELKDQIEKKLTVTRDKAGSRVEWR